MLLFPSDLFGDAVISVVERFQELAKQAAAFQKLLPRRTHISRAADQVLLMEQEVKALLKKWAIEYVPHSIRETGLYSRYFIVPKKDGELRPFLDLRVLNNSVMQLKFKMLTLRQIVPQIRSED